MLTARQQAFKDISAHLGDTQHMGKGGIMEVWKVTPSRMSHDKENTRLNRELGLHTINMIKDESLRTQ